MDWETVDGEIFEIYSPGPPRMSGRGDKDRVAGQTRRLWFNLLTDLFPRKLTATEKSHGPYATKRERLIAEHQVRTVFCNFISLTAEPMPRYCSCRCGTP